MQVHSSFFSHIIFAILFPLFTQGQDTLTWQSPVDHVVRLSGNFMELRNNHFHTGIDIKSSDGKIGDTIRVVADGYVSRIKVQNGSYGQVLYIDHPNGLTSVYAHLERFNDEISRFVEDMQYTLESYEVDLYLPDSLFKLNMGDHIGEMGNTGRSFGPHLHFEIRETDTEKPLDPEDFGFAPRDKIAPSLQSLEIYHLDKSGKVIENETRYFKSQGPYYSLHNASVRSKTGVIAFGFTAYDQIDGSYNKNGIHAYKLYVDDSLSYEWEAGNYAFEESKKINGFLDYKAYIERSVRIYKMFSPACSRLDYFGSQSEGFLNAEPGREYELKLEVFDSQGNSANLNWSLAGSESDLSIHEYDSYCDSNYIIRAGMFEIDFPPACFFERPEPLTIQKSQAVVMDRNCHELQILDKFVALAGYYKISCPLPPDDPMHWCYIMKDRKGRWISFDADTLDGKLVAQLDQCGTVYLFKDNVAPQIDVINLELDKTRAWRFRIRDNLIPDGKTPDLQYEARADGKWLRFRYDLKSDMLLFDDFERLPGDEFELILSVSDAQHNTSIYRNKIKLQ